MALAAGAALRLSFPADIEWKADEQWTFLHAQAMAAGGAWPTAGMASSVGAPNPGLSLWAFAALFELFGVRQPPDLARAVQTLNVLALVAFAAFTLLAIPRSRREPWLWAAALWAVNPVAVILERKIWPPSLLPLAMVALLWAWRFRRQPAAAAAWGALGALMAQIHLGAAFLALAVAGWTLAADRARFPWRSWLIGAALGAAPALPWLMAMLHGGGAHLAPRLLPRIGFFPRWATQMFGFGPDYTLGRAAFADYLTGPRLGGSASYLMAAAQLALAALLLATLAGAVARLRREGWPSARSVFLGDSPETRLIAAALWGYGGLLTMITFAGAGAYRHYLIVVTPIMALWSAMAVLWSQAGRARARVLLASMCLLQAAMSAQLLVYIDQRGVIPGEFGASWKAQQAARG